jgi:MerR family transcriptional regulator, copper efflux regulator
MMARQHTSTLELAEARHGGLSEIGVAAEASGVSIKMIRHYEKIGLIPPARRTLSNYRVYSDTDIHSLRFIRSARELGFTIKQIETLLGLWRDRQRASADVKALALQHVDEIEQRIEELSRMRDTLIDLARRCRGDQRPDCPILAKLSDR